MPLFQYEALNAEGRKQTGVLEADSLQTAKERLRSSDTLVTKIALAQQKKQQIVLGRVFRLSFTRELAQLLKAGLPLYESLKTIEEKYRKDKAHPVLLDLIDRLKQGQAFSSVLKAYSESFDEIYQAMVQAAEQTGSLPEVFSQLTYLLERKDRLRKQILSATTYPAFLGVFSLLVFVGLLFWVVPSMEDLFDGKQVHPLTQLVLQLSSFARHNVSFIVAGLGSVGVLLWGLLRKKVCRVRIHSALLRAPLLKTIFLQSALARFARAGSLLLVSGIPLIETLRLTRAALHHPILEAASLTVEEKVLEGGSLYREMHLTGVFPLLVIRLLSIAEETGKMDKAFEHLADIYEEELEKSLSQLTTILQPALLLFLGVVVGIVVLSILLPLTDVGSFIN